MDELKKRLIKWLKKWSFRLGGVATLVGSNWVSYLAGKGEDLSKLTTGLGWVAVAVLGFIVLNKVK